MTTDKFEIPKKIFRDNNNILRRSTAIKLGIPEHTLYSMFRNGELIREASGLYRLSESEPLGNPDLVQVSLKVAKGIVFLLSALYFHKLTTQIPPRVYIALPKDVKKPRVDYPPLSVFYLSQKPYMAGIEEYKIDGVTVKVYSKEKTIADCFKFRRYVGKDIALEALKDYMNESSPNISRLVEYAKINRVEKIIRPYIEAL